MRYARAVSFALARLRTGHGQCGPGRRPIRATCCRRRRSSTSSTSPAARGGAQPVARRRRRARARADADHRRAVAADAAPGRPAHRPGHQRPPPRPHRPRADAEGGGRRRRAAGHAAAVAGADLARLLADGARFAFTQTRPTGIELWIGETATGTRQGDAGRRSQRRAGHAVRVGGHGRARWSAPPPCLVAARPRPRRAVPTGPNVQEHRGGVVAGAHLPGPADLGARRGALRVLRHAASW